MAKKGEKQTEINKQTENPQSYEKLRDELFQYRVDIQSYRRSMNALWACVPVIMAILAFFGYNKVEALLDKVEQSANERLSETDALLSKVDAHYLDSLTAIVEERTIAYEEAIAALEKGTRVNNELYTKLISGLPYNKRVETKVEPYVGKSATNLFDIVFYSEKYKYGQTGECYVVMGDEYSIEKDDVFLIEVRPRNRHMIISSETFEVLGNYNKFHFRFGQFEQYSDYELSVVLLRKKGKDTMGYKLSMPITAQ